MKQNFVMFTRLSIYNMAISSWKKIPDWDAYLHQTDVNCTFNCLPGTVTFSRKTICNPLETHNTRTTLPRNLLLYTNKERWVTEFRQIREWMNHMVGLPTLPLAESVGLQPAVLFAKFNFGLQRQQKHKAARRFCLEISNFRPITGNRHSFTLHYVAAIWRRWFNLVGFARRWNIVHKNFILFK